VSHFITVTFKSAELTLCVAFVRKFGVWWRHRRWTKTDLRGTECRIASSSGNCRGKPRIMIVVTAVRKAEICCVVIGVLLRSICSASECFSQLLLTDLYHQPSSCVFLNFLTSVLLYLNCHLVYISFSHPKAKFHHLKAQVIRKNIQGSAYVRNIIVLL